LLPPPYLGFSSIKRTRTHTRADACYRPFKKALLGDFQITFLQAPAVTLFPTLAHFTSLFSPLLQS